MAGNKDSLNHRKGASDTIDWKPKRGDTSSRVVATPGPRRVLAIPRMMAFLLISLQGFHVLEHVAQSVQKFILLEAEAHGLLGAAFDFEWLHLAYNVSLAAGLFLLLVVYARRGGLRTQGRPWSVRAFGAAVALQGYHFIEHAVRIQQLLATGIPDPRGILGNVVDVVLLHLGLNLVVYVLMVPLLAACIAHAIPCRACVPREDTHRPPASTV